MKLWISGSKWLGREVAERLAVHHYHDIVGVSAPEGDQLRDWAWRNGVRDIAEWGQMALWPPLVWGAAPVMDLLVLAHSEEFIPASARSHFRHGAIGYHPSLLPHHRGNHAVEYAIAAGDRVTGGSVYWLTDELDAGPLAMQCHVLVRTGDTAKTLWRRDLAPLGIWMLAEVIHYIGQDLIVQVPQVDVTDLDTPFSMNTLAIPGAALPR